MSDVAELLAEASWLTRLARSLTRNAADADDAVQETFAVALRSPPDPDRPARPWLRRVLVNVVRMRHRGRVRGDAREAATQHVVEPAFTPEQLLERAQVERTLSDLVLALEEPYRTTVWLRYREGLTAEAIAAQQGVPAGTVRRRLKTALDRLREGLDDKESPKAWRAAFAPFLVPRQQSVPWWRIVMANVATKTGVAVIVVLLLALGGGAAWWWHGGGAPTPVVATSSRIGDRIVPLKPGSERAASVFAQPGLGTRELSGRVTFQGKPFAGATVRVIHALTHTSIAERQSADDGSFSFAALPADELLAIASADDKTAAPVIVDLRAPKKAAVELALTGCSHIRGVITDGSDAPIAHAHVSRADTAWPSAESNDLGNYDLCTHFGDTYILYTASGYQGVLARFTPIVALSHRDMVLLPEATVAGVVVTADGKPVADAWITIDPRNKGQVRDAPVFGRSGPDGTFRLVGVASGRTEISAVAPGLASRRIGIVLGAGDTTESLILRVDPASRISGHVISHGQPVPGASVGLRVGGVPETGLAVTQPDGSFTIDRAPRGELGLVIENYSVVTPRSVHVGDGDARVEIEATPIGTITGIVTLHGLPVADADVACPDPAGPKIQPHPVTDRSGTFSCSTPTAGAFEITASDGEGRWGDTKGVLELGTTAHINIELSLEGSICGTVRDEAGHPLGGIHIEADDHDDSGHDTSNEDGTFCVGYLMNEGSYKLWTSVGGQRVDPVTPLPPVKLEHGHADVAIVLAAPTFGISGIVLDAQGAPVVDVSVRARSSSAEVRNFDQASPLTLAITDQSGHFMIGHLGAGNYALLATARDGSEQGLDSIAAGRNDVKIVLAAAGRIEGTLVGFLTTPAIIGVLRSSGHEPVDVQVDGTHFSAAGLSPGRYVLTADTNGHGGGDAKAVDVTAGKTTSVILTSRGTATIFGKVIDWNTREPVANAQCVAPVVRQGASFGVVYGTADDGVLSDSSGAYRLEDVSAGDAFIMCANSIEHGTRSVTVPRDQTSHLDVYTLSETQRGTIDAHLDLARRFDQVTPGGQADQAGLQLGDEVTSVDGRPVVDVEGGFTLAVISSRSAGKPALLTVQRGGATRTVTVIVGD